MRRKSCSRVLALALCVAILYASLALLATIGVQASGTTLFTEDTFDNTTYSSEVWETVIKDSSKVTTPYSFGPAGAPDYMELPAAAYGNFFNGASSVTYIKETYLTPKPKKVTVRFKLSDGNAAYNNSPMLMYYNPDNDHFAGVQFKAENNKISDRRFLLSSGVTVGQAWGDWAANGTAPFSTTNQWITIEANYDYSKFNLTNKQLIIAYRITSENGAICTTWVATYTLSQADIESDKVSFAFLNDIGTGSKTIIDYVNVEREKTQAELDAEAAADFRAAHSAILNKTANSVTIATDSTSVAQALTDYNVLTQDVKTLLTAEFTLLSNMINKLRGDIPAFSGDSFSDSFLTNNYWKTDIIYSDAVTTPYALGTESSNGYLKLPYANGRGGDTIPAYNMASSFTYVDEAYWTARPETVSFKMKMNDLNAAYNGASLLFYYDPDTTSFAGIELAVSGGKIYNRRTCGYDVAQSSVNWGTAAPIVSGDSATHYDISGQWITIEVAYDYTNFDSANRQLGITCNIKDGSNNPIITNMTATYTLSPTAFASEKVFLAFTNDRGTNSRTWIDSVTAAFPELPPEPDYEVTGSYIAEVPAQMTVSDFQNTLAFLGTVKSIKDSQGVPLSGAALIATGSVVTLSDDQAFTVVIYGDVTGDGLIGATDLIAMKEDMLGIKTTPLAGCYLEAGKVIGKAGAPSITVADLVGVKKTIVNQ